MENSAVDSHQDSRDTNDKSGFTFDIVVAQEPDAALIAELGAAVYTKSYGWSVSAADRESYVNTAYTARTWETILNDPNSSTFVARPRHEQSKILGFVQLKRGSMEESLGAANASQIELHRIYVASEAHGKGVGKALFRKATATALDEGFQHMWLGVWENATWAIPFYESLGFRKVGEHGFPVGGDVQNDWIMLKKL